MNGRTASLKVAWVQLSKYHDRGSLLILLTIYEMKDALDQSIFGQVLIRTHAAFGIIIVGVNWQDSWHPQQGQKPRRLQ